MRPIRFLLVRFILALSAFFGASPAAAQTALPPSLQGEYLSAFETTFFDQGSAEVTTTCTPAAGETMTVSFRAEGVAIGPYPGTFTESGTAKATLLNVFAVAGFARGIVIEWNSTFTIDSPAGKVTGTKTLSQVLPEYNNAACIRDLFVDFGPDFRGFTTQAEVSAIVHYEATIKPPTGGTFRDQGESFALANEICYWASEPCDLYRQEYFTEYFYLSTGVLPVDTHGKATGGGQVLSGSNPLERVTFGFNVRKDEDGDRLQGNCNVLDHATGAHVKCLTVTDYQQVGNTATWEGTAELNGVEEDYRITVQDNGEPNQGIDTFSIVTESYEAAGNVEHGNVQLHKQELASL